MIDITAAGVSAPDLVFTSFVNIHAQTGERMQMTWAAWAQARAASAVQQWPTAEHLCRELADIEDTYPDEDVADASAIAWKEAKLGLPVEVGAGLADNRRADAAVHTISWLFLDFDKAVTPVDVAALVRRLAGFNYLVIESPTSRTQDKGLRIHCYIQIAPLNLPAPPVPVRDVKAWWQRLYAVASTTIADGMALDTTVDDMAQPCFVSSLPPYGDRRGLTAGQGMALDLERLADLVAQPCPRPWLAAPAAAAAVTAAAVPTAAPATAPATAPTPKLGPTEGHSTGSLVHMAAAHFGWLIDSRTNEPRLLNAAKKMYAVRCPWADHHTSDPRQGMGWLDESTVIYEAAEEKDGGFKCFHNGDGSAGTCKHASAADFLRWARQHGAPLPDRPDWGGGGAAPEGKSSSSVGSSKKDGRPKIYVKVNDNKGMCDAAIAALARHASVYQRDGVLLDLTAAGPRTMPREHLLTLLGTVADWASKTMDKEGNWGEKVAKIPSEIPGAILKAPSWPGVRTLRSVARHPQLLPDGTILSKPGYDEASQILLLPDAEYNVPSSPTKADAMAAKDRLLAYIKDTRFSDERGPSVWLAFLLSQVARAAVPTVPIFGFDAAAAGSGKTSLVKIAYGLVHGEMPALASPPSDDAEAEKRLPTWATSPLICWDNLKATFASPIVDQAITAGRCTVRRLGTNDGLSVDLSATSWAMTGNNIAIGDDAASRCLIARLDAPTSRKYAFAVDDVAYYKAQRPHAISDALKILAAFISAGSPQQPDVPYCRFVEFSRLFRQALLWLGMPDPVGGEVVDTEAEGKATILRQLAAWRADGDTSEAAASVPFYTGDLNWRWFKADDESAEAYTRRSDLLASLGALIRKRILTIQHLSDALGKMRDATTELSDGRSLTLRYAKPKKKSVYQLVFSAA